MCRRVVYLIPFVLVMVLASTGIAQTGRETGPVPAGWWRLDGNADDSSGNNNHGTLVGNPQWVAGMFAGALDVDGANDHVNCGNGASLNVTGPMTLSAWVYPTGSGSSTLPRIVDKSNGTGGADPGYKLYLRSANNYIFTLSAGGTYFNSTLAVPLDTWSYVAFVITGTQWRLCVNGTWEQWSQAALPSVSTNPFAIGNSPAGARHFDGMLDDVRLYGAALTDEEIQEVMKGPPLPGTASKPVPENGAVDVSRDVTLSWTSGQNEAAIDEHIVYLSANFSDVNDGVGGVTVSGSSYTPGRLDLGTMYYWRVDGVGAAGVFPGSIWSFTVEPHAYPIQNVTATASSARESMGPENTVNGSGLNANDEHSMEGTHMWLSTGEQPNWIQYEFDRAYKLHELWVWNSNQLVEQFVGLGAKEVRIEYSLDGSTWTELAGVPEFARATATADYAHNTTVPFGGALAKYVRLTIHSTWGGLAQAGLSEVRFLYVPVRAREPMPADAATGMPLDTTLSWRAGREAASHRVYLSKDRDAVVNATAPATTVTDPSFSPGLDYGATYYWRVDEVNDAAVPPVHEGSVWSFTTEDYGVIDDFESYNDDDRRIFDTWLDGYDSTTNGSQVGYVESPFAERTIFHGGEQSMPLFFSNTGGASHSEAEMTFRPAQDWTAGGTKTLSLWLYGDPNNTGASVYVKVNGVKVAYDGDADDLVVGGWRPWNVSLASFSTNLQNVTKLVIGIDGNGATGKLFLDDIRLYPRERQFITPAEPNTTGLVAHYKLDQDGADSSGNKNHGTVVGNPPWVPGKVGNAVNLDGGHDYIDCGNGPSLDITGPMTVVAWVHPTGPGGGNFGRILDKSAGTNAADPGYKLYVRGAENYTVTLGIGGGDHRSISSLVSKSWNFLGFVATGTQWQLCLNGTWEQWEETRFPTSATNPLFIGNSPTADRHFQGMIDEVRIYNRMLTPGEIAWLSGRTKPFDMPF